MEKKYIIVFISRLCPKYAIGRYAFPIIDHFQVEDLPKKRRCQKSRNISLLENPN